VKFFDTAAGDRTVEAVPYLPVGRSSGRWIVVVLSVLVGFAIVAIRVLSVLVLSAVLGRTDRDLRHGRGLQELSDRCPSTEHGRPHCDHPLSTMPRIW